MQKFAMCHVDSERLEKIEGAQQGVHLMLGLAFLGLCFSPGDGDSSGCSNALWGEA